MKRLFLFVFILSISLTCHALPMLIHNVNGYTISQGKLVKFNAILFDNDTIIGIGDKQKLAQKVTFNISIDGKGKTLLPGLIDAHGHILGLGNNLQLIELRGLSSIAESTNKVAEYYEKYPKKNWILGRGWNQVLWDSKQFPNKQDLDKVVNDKPVWLRRIDGHAGWANSKALELAGITKQSKSPKGGKIIKDKNGQPTGVLIDTAMQLIEEKLPKQSQLERQTALEIAFEHLISLGITSIHDAGIDFETFRLMLKMSEQSRIPIRVYAMLAGNSKNLDAMLTYGKVNDDFLKIQSVKLYSDGALGSRGAALKAPYSDSADNKGLLFNDDKTIQDKIKKIANRGYQVNVHAIGDQANHQVLSAFEKLGDKISGKALRHRIEHAQIVDLEDIPLFKKLNIIASMQPTHATSDMNMAEDRVGSQRIKGAYAWRTMLNNGVRIAAGSDFPVELANPFHGMHAAITRQSHSAEPKDGWYPEEKLTAQEALQAFTSDAAYAGFWDEKIGSLEKGKKADFIIIDQDPFSTQEQDSDTQIWQTKVLQTWINGVQVFQSP